MLVANTAQIREADRIQIKEKHFPSILLMESAGRQAADKIIALYPQQQYYLVLAGPGNNGGDGLVIARYLHLAGKQVQVLLSHGSDRYRGDASINYSILRQLPVSVEMYTHEEVEKCLEQFSHRPVLIDALLGTGIQSRLRAPIKDIIRFFRPLTLTTVAIDLPSGLNADTGEAINEVLNADVTLTFQLPKICHYVTPASSECGEIITFDIGIWPEVIDRLDIKRSLINDAFVRKTYLHRKSDAHKGDFGHVLIIGGSKNMAGAIAMTAYACVKAGVGLCTVVVPESCRTAVNMLCPEAMCMGLAGENHDFLTPSAIQEIEAIMGGKSAILLGPGMGLALESSQFIKTLLPKIEVPLVVDADGLNHLAANTDLLASLPSGCILTPHAGEMKRLSQQKKVHKKRLEIAESFSKTYNCITVMKGAGTLVSLPSGGTYINISGNPGMASGGSGDILTGIIGALLGQAYEPETAAPLGVYLHGKAGDAICQQIGAAGVTATAMADVLSKVWNDVVEFESCD